MTAQRLEQQFELQCSNSCLDYRLSLCVLLLFISSPFITAPLSPARLLPSLAVLSASAAAFKDRGIPVTQPATPTPSARPPSRLVCSPWLAHLPTSPFVPSRPRASSVRLLVSCASPLACYPASSVCSPPPSDHLPPPLARQTTHPHTPLPLYHDAQRVIAAAQSAVPATKFSPRQDVARGARTATEHCPRGVRCSLFCAEHNFVFNSSKVSGDKNKKRPPFASCLALTRPSQWQSVLARCRGRRARLSFLWLSLPRSN